MRTEARLCTLATVAAAALAACIASEAGAYALDARRLGMGGVVGPRDVALVTANVAYRAVPARPTDGGRVVPLPLGLVQLATQFPTLDAASESFDVLRITETVLHPPFFLELREPNPLDGDIAISIARNAFSVNFADAQALLPQEPIRAGAVYEPPLMSLGLRGAQTFVSPLLQAEGRMTLNDPLYAVLSHGEPLLPNSQYHLEASATTLAATSLHAGWSGAGWSREGDDGLYLGAFAKYVLGFGFETATTRFGLATADTIFGDQDPLDVTFDAMTRHSGFGRFGSGVGVDAGIAYRTGPMDVGLGVRDVVTNVWFGNTDVEHSYLDDNVGEIVSETVVSGERYRLRIPTQTTLNLSWTGASTLLAADLTTSRWGTHTHLGAERRVAWLAVRGGLLTDERNKLQYACGLGFGLARVWLDVGLQSHSFALTQERGWTLGTSLALR